jgi:hypothetical protein
LASSDALAQSIAKFKSTMMSSEVTVQSIGTFCDEAAAQPAGSSALVLCDTRLVPPALQQQGVVPADADIITIGKVAEKLAASLAAGSSQTEAISSLSDTQLDSGIGMVTFNGQGIVVRPGFVLNEDAPLSPASTDLFKQAATQSQVKDLMTQLQDMNPAALEVCGSTCPAECNNACSPSGGNQCCTR